MHTAACSGTQLSSSESPACAEVLLDAEHSLAFRLQNFKSLTHCPSQHLKESIFLVFSQRLQLSQGLSEQLLPHQYLHAIIEASGGGTVSGRYWLIVLGDESSQCERSRTQTAVSGHLTKSASSLLAIHLIS